MSLISQILLTLALRILVSTPHVDGQGSSGTVFLWDLPNETALLTSLGALPDATLPSQCHTISDLDTSALASSLLMETFGCDQRSRASCCLARYQRLGYYNADNCPEGYTPTSEEAYGITIGTATGSICCPTAEAQSDWSRDGHKFFYSQGSQSHDVLLNVYCLWYNKATAPVSHSVWVASVPAVFIIPLAQETSTSERSIATSQTVDGSSPNVTSGDSEPHNNGLPTGAIAGIAVGVAVPVLAIIAFVGWRLTRGRRARNTGSKSDASPEWLQTGGYENDNSIGGIRN